MSKHKNLQPWLDYFQMLRRYEEKGFLQIEAERHEAYVTRAALLTLVPDDILVEKTDKSILADTARRIRTYAAFKAQQGEGYLRENFALHAVKEDEPHDLLFTIMLEKPKQWFPYWPKTDKLEVITY